MGTIVRIVMTAALVTGVVGQTKALTPQQTCQAAKLKVAGRYALCRLKADAKAVKSGDPADYIRCAAKFNIKYSQAETAASGACPTIGDLEGVDDQVMEATAALKQLAARFVDNGDGTVSDTRTGLMWEQKDDLGGIHDKDNVYPLSATGTVPDGTAYTAFLGTLNTNTSGDAFAISGCFAGYCDWRLPTGPELLDIVDITVPGCSTGPACIDPTFGATAAAFHWTSSTDIDDATQAWGIGFGDGAPYKTTQLKTDAYHVRAVRRGR